MKERLDVMLVKRNLAESREKAKAVIMSGNVFVDGQREDKAGSTFASDVHIEVKGHALPYVSRGGFKLEKALETFDVDVKGKVGLDGVLKFEGLGAGTYTIKETKAPENYNKIDDITVNITCKLPEKIDTGNEPCTWKYKIGSEEVKEAANGIITLDIQNRSGAELPSTGGIGTTIFVYGGIILMVLALGVVAVRTYSRKKNA